MYHVNDITLMGDIEEVFAEALRLLQDNEPRQARDILDTFLTTDEGDFTYFACEEDEGLEKRVEDLNRYIQGREQEIEHLQTRLEKVEETAVKAAEDFFSKFPNADGPDIGLAIGRFIRAAHQPKGESK